jgi:hypothetical protein
MTESGITSIPQRKKSFKTIHPDFVAVLPSHFFKKFNFRTAIRNIAVVWTDTEGACMPCGQQSRSGSSSPEGVARPNRDETNGSNRNRTNRKLAMAAGRFLLWRRLQSVAKGLPFYTV